MEEEPKTICTTCSRVRYGYCDGEKELESCQFYKRMTNGDRIRSMGDEELADLFIEKHDDENYFACPVRFFCGCYKSDCLVCFLDWLKQEVSE